MVAHLNQCHGTLGCHGTPVENHWLTESVLKRILRANKLWPVPIISYQRLRTFELIRFHLKNNNVSFAVGWFYLRCVGIAHHRRRRQQEKRNQTSLANSICLLSPFPSFHGIFKKTKKARFEADKLWIKLQLNYLVTQKHKSFRTKLFLENKNL